MNIRKNIDYSEMYAELDKAMRRDLSRGFYAFCNAMIELLI